MHTVVWKPFSVDRGTLRWLAHEQRRKDEAGVLGRMSFHAIDGEATDPPALGGAREAATPKERAGRAFEDYRLLIYRYLVSLGTDPAKAQEITQETFLKLYMEMRRGKQIRNVRAWLFAAASNRAVNEWRAERYRPTVATRQFAWLESQTDASADPEQALLERERAETLYEAIQTLSMQQRVCLHMRAEGFRYREIAEILGIGIPSVGEYLRRAIARLKNIIHE